MECHYCHSNTRKAYCVVCIQQKINSSEEEQVEIIKERDDILSQADEFVQKATLIQFLLVEKNKRIKALDDLKEQQKTISSRCLSKSKRIIELKKQIQSTQKIQNESVARRQIQISNDHRSKNQVKLKIKSWQRIHKKVIFQRRVLMEDIKSWFVIINKQDNVFICNQTLPTLPIEIPKYPTEELNAATHILVQLLILIVNYLGIKLPFSISRKDTHYRIELAKSNTINSVKKKKKMHLFLNKGEKNYQKFVHGMAMLNYNIAYLCHTQEIKIPLNQQVTHTLQNIIMCLDTPLPSKLGMYSHSTCLYGIRNLDFSMDYKQVLELTKQCYQYIPLPEDIEEKISEMDLNDHYFSKSHPTEQQEANSDDDELYSDSDDNDEKTVADDLISNENWNLVDVMTSFGSEGTIEENNGGGESIFQLGASMIPGVMNMVSNTNSQQSHISKYLYRRTPRH